MLASNACTAALKRVMASLAQKFASELPPSISAIRKVLPVHNGARSTNIVSKSTNHTSIRPLASNGARKVVYKRSGTQMSVISARHFSLTSPLLIDQSEPVFLSFSRRQWFFFFGGLVVLGVGTVQYMGINAVKKMLSTLDDNLVNNATLGTQLFRNMTASCRSSQLATIAKHEPLVSLACRTVVNLNVDAGVRAAASKFLVTVWDDDNSHAIILKHLNVGELARQFVVDAKKKDYTESTAVLMALAFATRPPSEDAERSWERQQQALTQLQPFVTLQILGKVISLDKGLHPLIINSGVLEPILKMLETEKDFAIDLEILYQLSTSETGRTALVKSQIFPFMLSNIVAPNSRLNSLYFEKNGYHPNSVYIYGVLANFIRARSPEQVNWGDSVEKLLQTDPVILNRLEKFNYGEALQSLKYLSWASACALSSAMCLGWAPIRGLARNYIRGFQFPLLGTIFHSTWRAMIGAPLFVAMGIATDIAAKSVKDERLFITTHVLGTTALLFGVRAILTAAPFSVLPAALATFATFGSSAAEKTARQEQVRKFQEDAKKPDILDELDDE